MPRLLDMTLALSRAVQLGYSNQVQFTLVGSDIVKENLDCGELLPWRPIVAYTYKMCNLDTIT